MNANFPVKSSKSVKMLCALRWTLWTAINRPLITVTSSIKGSQRSDVMAGEVLLIMTYLIQMKKQWTERYLLAADDMTFQASVQEHAPHFCVWVRKM